jgi:DNA-binding phage protein
MLKITRFDAADFLDTEKKQAAYITVALETGDADFVRDALALWPRRAAWAKLPRQPT